MKNRRFVILAFAIIALMAQAQNWAPVGNRIKTRWASQIDVNNVRPEYPRPTMVRSEWKNLNGLWNYAIQPIGQTAPTAYDGKILVPFCIESSLSGVGKTMGKDNELWYSRTFTVPKEWKGQRVLLHFDAVDWACEVWVNGVKVGSHTGGYTQFAFDVTQALKNGDNEVKVRVQDPTDSGYQPRGKQVNKPGGIWYTSVTGIWQTVWMEPVASTYIASLRTTPDIDAHRLSVNVANSEDSKDVMATVKVFAEGKLVSQASSLNNEAVDVPMPADAKLWSPSDPYLYDLEVTITRGGKVLDQVKSYAAMRKISTHRDANGVVRLQLNNKDQYQLGPLDQGWWPDGLYTAPTYEAMKYDIDMTKELGFNMIRKHVKVEPPLWYAYCDQKGIIVWQDMPSGDKSPKWQNHEYFNGVEFVRSAESEANYRKEWREIIDCLYNHPCICTWVPFNEAWGQFKTQEIVAWTKAYDPSRLVNPASGGNFYTCGDMLDLHNYPAPALYLADPMRANVLGEYGGIGYAVSGHLWDPDRNWGYIKLKSTDEVTDKYVEYAKELIRLSKTAFTAAVYTQTTDVEIEVNGLMTYDRELVKVDAKRVKEINDQVTHLLK